MKKNFKKNILLFITILLCTSLISCTEPLENNNVNINKEIDENIISVTETNNKQINEGSKNKVNNTSKNYFKYCGEQKILNATVAVYEDKENILYVAENEGGACVITSIKIRDDYKPDKIDVSNNYFRYIGEQDILNSKIAIYEDIHHGTTVYLSLETSACVTSISTNYNNV